MKNSPSKIISFLLLSLIVLTGCQSLTGGEAEALQASGVVEAVEISVSSELGGRVAEVWVSEGAPVASGDPLFRLEDQLLTTQLRQAESALVVAQASYDLIAAGLTDEQNQAAVAAAELGLANARYALDQLLEEDYAYLAAQTLQAKDDAEKALEDLQNPELQQALALQAIAEAEKAIQDAEKRLNIVQTTASQADIDAAKAQVILAEKALDDAREDFEPYENKPEDNLTRATFQAQLSAAQQAYDAAVRRLNALEGTGSEVDKAIARADLATAQANLREAQRDWEEVKDGPNPIDLALLEAQITALQKDWEQFSVGPDPDDLAVAEAQVAHAEAQLALAQASSPTAEQLAVAEAQVAATQAQLDAIQVQIDLLVVTAPVDGVVMIRGVEPGEVIAPGVATFTLIQLQELTITVYIPEDRYGGVSLGDEAEVTADSFPGESFLAQVVRIADRAEYTPRNVQTQEERSTTVYAVELAVGDTGGDLKPGMPVDVAFP